MVTQRHLQEQFLVQTDRGTWRPWQCCAILTARENSRRPTKYSRQLGQNVVHLEHSSHFLLQLCDFIFNEEGVIPVSIIFG
jgi:hypothetical protein